MLQNRFNLSVSLKRPSSTRNLTEKQARQAKKLPQYVSSHKVVTASADVGQDLKGKREVSEVSGNRKLGIRIFWDRLELILNYMLT